MVNSSAVQLQRNANTYIECRVTMVCMNVRAQADRVFAGFWNLIVCSQIRTYIVIVTNSLCFTLPLAICRKFGTLKSSHMMSDLFCCLTLICCPIQLFNKSISLFTLCIRKHTYLCILTKRIPYQLSQKWVRGSKHLYSMDIIPQRMEFRCE